MKKDKTDILLSSDQLKALYEVENFLRSDSKVFILTGSAGTGKTSLISYIESATSRYNYSSSIATPTARAAEIIKRKGFENVSTIHSMIYKYDRIEEEEKNGNVTYHFRLRSRTEAGKTLYIVDEASLVSDNNANNDDLYFGSGYLLTDLFEYIFAGENNENKLLFIGDAYQLPPVNMNLSPALSAEYMDEKFNLESKLSTYELSQVLRQKSESLILKNATAIRDNLKEETYFKLDFEFGDDFKKISNFDIAGDFVQKFRENPDEAVIIAYTNASVRNYNKQVRELLFHNLSSIVPGDRIVVSKNNIKHGFLNGQMLYVENVDEERESKSIKFRGEPAVNLVFTNIEVSYTDPEGQKLLQEVKILNNFLESADGKIEKNILRALLVDFKKRFKAAGHTKSEFKEYLRNDEYYNALFIKHGYAITCHKAQGGEWDNVYFDFKQQSNRFSEMYSRYCYTGITRSKKQLYTINSPEKSIFSDKIKIKKGGQVPGILKMNAANICVLEDANNLAEGLEDYLTDLLQSLDVRFSLERKGYRFEISLQYGIADYRTDVIFNNEGQIKIHHYFSDTQMDDVKEELDKLDQSIFVLQNNENDDEFITAIKNEMIEKIGLLDVKVISVKHSEYKVAMLVVYKNKLLGFDIYYNSMKSVTSLFVNSSSESVKDEIIEVLK